jgi:hypothetical protein
MARTVGRMVALVVLGLLASTGPANAQGLEDPADQWLPRSDGASWTYSWSNNTYSPAARTEQYGLQARVDTTFRLRWQEPDAPLQSAASAGTMDFQHTEGGLVNLNYQSTQPPLQFPILCAVASSCGNSMAGALYLVLWGTRAPVLAEPLLRGTRWGAQGGADNDVASDNRYAGRERVTVPAFPGGIEAAKVESQVTQAGAIGDPFGSGVRKVWWVRGVGPVRIEFRHAGGELSRAELQSTNLSPRPLPTDVNLLPLNRGDRAIYRWRNTRHMKKWSRQQFDVMQVVNNTAQVDVKHLSGPIAVVGSYLFSTRLSGVTLLSGTTNAATRAKFPPLGPRSDRRHFFTPFDLMNFGFNPVVPIGAVKGTTWRSAREGRDWDLFRVSGVSKVIATATKVRTPAGRFRTTVVRSRLVQRGHRFGSGTRTSYFAAGKGLVKLTFKHRDGSRSIVERER